MQRATQSSLVGAGHYRRVRRRGCCANRRRAWTLLGVSQRYRGCRGAWRHANGPLLPDPPPTIVRQTREHGQRTQRRLLAEVDAAFKAVRKTFVTSRIHRSPHKRRKMICGTIREQAALLRAVLKDKDQLPTPKVASIEDTKEWETDQTSQSDWVSQCILAAAITLEYLHDYAADRPPMESPQAGSPARRQYRIHRLAGARAPATIIARLSDIAWLLKTLGDVPFDAWTVRAVQTALDNGDYADNTCRRRWGTICNVGKCLTSVCYGGSGRS